MDLNPVKVIHCLGGLGARRKKPRAALVEIGGLELGAESESCTLNRQPAGQV